LAPRECQCHTSAARTYREQACWRGHYLAQTQIQRVVGSSLLRRAMIPPRPAVPEIGAATSKARIGSVHLPRACIKNCIPTINGAFHRNLTTCVHRIRSLQLGLDTIEKLCCKSFCRTLHQARPHAGDGTTDDDVGFPVHACFTALKRSETHITKQVNSASRRFTTPLHSHVRRFFL